MAKIAKKVLNKKRVFWVIAAVLFIIGVSIGGILILGRDKKNQDDGTKKEVPEKQVDMALEIAKRYAKNISVINDGYLYKHNEGKYEHVGKIYKGAQLILEDIEKITKETQYFKIKDSDFYVRYSDVFPYDEEINTENPYTHTNGTIKTKESFHFYLEEVKLLEVNISMEFPVLVKNADNFVVLYNSRLLSIKKEDVETVTEPEPPKQKKPESIYANNIAVLNYHFFYDKNTQSCNESICLEKNNFEAQLKYLKDNGFKTLTMEEFNLWMDKKIALPRKSVLITVDDGAMGTDTHLIELLEKYDMKATLFLITAWWEKEKYVSPNLEIQSHGYDIHLEGYCTGVSRGARALCLSKEELIDDLNKSREKLDDNTIAFCYPFYLYNSNIMAALRETGFSLAFIGGNKKASQSSNKLLVPRYVIYKSTSLETFKNMVN